MSGDTATKASDDNNKALSKVKKEALIYHKQAGVATLTFNRPKARNAITTAMALDMERYLLDIAADDEIREVVLTGADKTFCAGADLMPESKEQRRETQAIAFPGDQGGDILDRCNRCILRLQRLPKPVLASISGNAVGIGCSFALAADLRIASVTAAMGVVFSKIGLGPDGGASYFLRQLVGSAKALELLFFGEKIPASQALELGLLNWVVAPEELESATNELAERLAKGPTLAYAMAKTAVYQGANLAIESALDLEARLQHVATRSQDAKEGISAFIERREPVFQGC